MLANFCALVLLCWLLAFTPRAHAWENLPEFQSLAEPEQQSGFEGPDSQYSEYFSDLLTYSVPPEWDYRWLSRSRALQLNFGSLNTMRFAMDNHLKIHQPITEHLEIRYTYFDESNFERLSSHNIIELVVKPWRQLGFVFYGEPSFRKPNDDTGLAILLRPSDRHEIRIFNTFVDVTRLKYPDTPDTFIEPDLPYARGLVGRAWGEPNPATGSGDFIQYALRYETPTQWQFNELNYRYSYWKGFTSLYARRQFSAALAAAFRLQLDRKHETRVSTGPTSAELGDWFTNRLTILAESTVYALGPYRDWDLTPGIELAARTWDTDLGTGTIRDLLPYVRIKIPAWGPPSRKGAWTLGYSLAWHREYGNGLTGIRTERDGSIEQRVNLTYEFSLGEFGSLLLLASADLDEIGTRRSWGGGSGQLQLLF